MNDTNVPKVAIVTGAGSGIGRAAALALIEAGFRVVLAGRRPEPLEESAALTPPGAATVIPTDVTNSGSVDLLFNTVAENFGRVDVLFNNAGVSAPAVAFDELTLEQWEHVFACNVTGVFLCAQAAFRHMKRQRPQGGRIINNGSLSAHVPRPHSAPYTASKHAVTGLTKALSLDGRQYDIACGQIDIGNAATEMTSRMSAGVPQASGTTAPEPTMDVQDVARAVVFMATLSLDSNVQFLTVMATKMPYVGRG